MKKAIITTLGMIGKDRNDNFNTAKYKFDPAVVKTDKTFDYVNIFPLLVQSFSDDYEIIPLYTDESLQRQRETLEFHKIDFDIEKNGRRIDENSSNYIFETINKIMEDTQYSEFIVDVTHGFRSIPILTTVNMIITNFQDNKKIKHIIYAEEDFSNKGNYLIKDLIEYLDIANMAFILTTFEKNYTVSSHIKSDKYKPLIDAMNDFSNDIMALNLNNLFTQSSTKLTTILNSITEASIYSQAKKLHKTIEKLTTYEGKKYYQTYLDLAKDLFTKNYMLLSLALLFESIRMYIKSTIKKEHKELVEKVEKDFKNDKYRINDFFKNLKHPIGDRYSRDDKNRNNTNLSKEEYKILKNEFDKLNIVKLYDKIDKKRNNLAHANTHETFNDIHNDIDKLIKEYEEVISKTHK